jgi:hypothetical protein
MDHTTFDIYEMSAEREKKIWADCIFVFDSSTLLDFYFSPKKTREMIYETIFNPNGKRFWIPAHVQYEYLKNRKKIITKPITEKYEPLKTKTLADIAKAIKEIETKTSDLQNSIKNKETHPHFDDAEVKQFQAQLKQFQVDASAFNENVTRRIDDVKKEINDLSNDDDVLNAFNKYLPVGKEYSFATIYELTKEGRHRYEFKIPPGYEDLNDKEKKGTQIFGDLIIWKQVLDYSKTAKKPIVFICNDLKEDWCHLDKTAKEKRICAPREELIKEMCDFSGSEFWMYNLPQFLYHANKYLGAKIEEKDIQTIATAINKRAAKGKQLVFRCQKCSHETSISQDEIVLDFECVESDERNMGTENHYQAELLLECEHCMRPIEAVFNIWEYPVGIHNYDDVKLEGADLLEVFPFAMDFFTPAEPEPDICSKCGEEFYDKQHIGICEKCDNEYGYGEK